MTSFQQSLYAQVQSYMSIFQYLHHGEQVVKACIENGTHHIDTSGEPLVCKDKLHTVKPVLNSNSTVNNTLWLLNAGQK